MNFSFSRILYIMRTLISSTMKIARKKMKITKDFLHSCDFPGVLEKKECLTGTPLGLYGIPGPIHKQTQIPLSTFPVSKSFDYHSGRRRASKTRVCGESSVPGEKPDHRREGARVPKGSQVLIVYN